MMSHKVQTTKFLLKNIALERIYFFLLPLTS
jgi:hypothetical protein